MALSLNNIFHETSNEYSITMVAGEKGLSNFFDWPHVLENIEAINFLKGNELIFTTGIGKCSDHWLKEYTIGLIHKGVSGLIVNLGRFISKISDEVIEICNRNNFPIFTIPWHIHLADIIRDYCNRLFMDNQTQISIAEAIKNAIYYPNMPELYQFTLERDGYVLNESFAIIHISSTPVNESSEYTKFDSQYLVHLQTLLTPALTHQCIYTHNNTLVIVLNQCSRAQLFQLIQVLSTFNTTRYTNYNLHIGCSSLKKGIQSLPQLYEQASAILTLARKTNLAYLQFDESPIYKLLLSVKDSDILPDIYQDILGPIDAYDQQHRTEYLDTLRLYLENNCSVQTVADIKFTHRNTINNRILKIRNLFNLDLTNSETRFRLQLAFHIKSTI